MLVEAQLKIINRAGLHARAASKFVQTANRYPCEVWIEKDGQRVNGKSIMGVLLLVASLGSQIRIQCEGPQAETCLQALTELIQNRFGEDE